MAKLEAMRYRDFVWPHNPKVYTIDYARRLSEVGVPYGRYVLQDMGFTRRILRGQGEFVGEGAYEDFKRLASVFYQTGPGILVHPVWQSVSVYFTALSLRQEPRSDYVSYSFEFREVYSQYDTGLKELTKPQEESGSNPESQAVWHTVARGESLWSIAGRYGAKPEEVIRLNPQLRNPSVIMVGERVRVK